MHAQCCRNASSATMLSRKHSSFYTELDGKLEPNKLAKLKLSVKVKLRKVSLYQIQGIPGNSFWGPQMGILG